MNVIICHNVLNLCTIDLQKPLGFFAIIDEESKFPKATDITLVDKLSTNCKKPELFRKSKINALSFTIFHFAGAVSISLRYFNVFSS